MCAAPRPSPGIHAVIPITRSRKVCTRPSPGIHAVIPITRSRKVCTRPSPGIHAGFIITRCPTEGIRPNLGICAENPSNLRIEGWHSQALPGTSLAKGANPWCQSGRWFRLLVRRGRNRRRDGLSPLQGSSAMWRGRVPGVSPLAKACRPCRAVAMCASCATADRGHGVGGDLPLKAIAISASCAGKKRAHRTRAAASQ